MSMELPREGSVPLQQEGVQQPAPSRRNYPCSAIVVCGAKGVIGVGLVLGVGFALLFYGLGTGKMGKLVLKPRTTVIVMRHCVRATDDSGIDATPGLEYMNNYSEASHPWPKFPVPAMSCLPRGQEIIEAQGHWIRSHGGLPLPLRAIADDVPEGQRDKVTLQNFMKGLALAAEDVTMSVDHAPFVPNLTDKCLKVRYSDAATQKAMQEFIAANPPPPGYQESLKRLYEVLGQGAAGNWTGIPCTAGSSPWDGISMPVGACEAASKLVERLLMEWGGGMDVGWGRVAATELPSLMVLHAWAFHMWFGVPALYTWAGASLIRDISARLNEPEAGTTLYVGHDSDIMMVAGALGLTWNASPFPENATLPGSMLRFDLEDDFVTASYHYVQDFGGSFGTGTFGSMLTTPAHFSRSSPTISLPAFQLLVEQGSLAECASPVSSHAASIQPLPVLTV